jgi:uncharacterized membrane protein
VAGTLALVAGLAAMLSRKGGRLHRRAGQIYVASMAVATVTALALVIFFSASAFLGPVAVLAFYSTFSGWRVLRRAAGTPPHRLDRAAAAATVLAGAVLVGQALRQGANVVMLVLGGIALALGAGGLRAGPVDHHGRRQRHLRSMLAAYIGTVTAFSAVNLRVLPVTVRWLWPTVLGTVAILLWSRAESRRQAGTQLSRSGGAGRP